MSDTLKFGLSLSIVFAVIIGVIRFRKINPSYYPFIYRVTLSLVVELIRRVLILQNDLSAATLVTNIFALADFLLFAWLFHNWGLFKRDRNLFLATIFTGFVVWCIATYTSPRHFFSANLYFRILYSFTLIFFSVTTLNSLIINTRGGMLKNAKCWICIGIIIFYTLFVIICTTQLSVLRENVSKDFQRRFYDIMVFSNLFVNLLYAAAALWIPRRKVFSTVY
jgi:hypothetical protein